jgi:two-component system cell cycle sensor histidine kinase/response regulator CckA
MVELPTMSSQTPPSSLGLLGTILESIPARVFWKDRASRYLGCNAALARDAGLRDPQDIVGKTDHDLPWREHAELYRADDRAVMSSGQPRRSYEEPLVLPDGARVWLRTSKFPLRDARGEVIGVLGMFDDITAQRETEEALRRSVEAREAAVQRLRESERQFRDLFERSPDPCLLIDDQNRFTLGNHAATLALGLADGEALRGLHPGDLSPPRQPDGRDSRGKADAMMALAHARGVHRFEWSHRRSDGEVFRVEVTLARFDDTRQRQLYCVWRDLGEREAQQRALLETRALHEEAQRIAHLGHWLLDHRERTLRWSDETFRIFGVDPATHEVSLAGFFRAVHPEDRDGLRVTFEQSVRARTAYDTDHRIITPDGELRWVKERCETTYDDDGRPLLSTGTAMDITDLKRAEERLRSSLDFLGKIITHAAEGIAVLHLAGGPKPQFSVWNDRIAEITGYPREEVNRLGLLDALFPDPEHRAVVESRLRDACLGVGPQDQPWEITTRAGERRTLSLSTSRVTLEDGQPAVVLLAQDVTERLRAAQEHERLRAQLDATQRLESVGRLAGGVAHDFNNMLGVILGRTHLAMEHLDPESPARADLQEILDAAQRSAELTHQLLAFARRQTVAPVDLDLDEKITGLLKMLRRLIGEDITLEWVPAARLHRVRMDPSQVDQVLTNLCINARDAITAGGTVRIETHNVTAQRPDDDDGATAPRACVCVTVTDTGRGMSESVLEHLFEPFFTTKGVGQGTGLGLATVYGIVKQNGGHIEVHSAPDAGSTFRIFLPAVTDGAAPLLEAPSAPPPRAGSGTVLLVEDEPAVMRVTHRFLERLGYHVLPASSAAEALALAASHTDGIDLLLTDVIMPELSGGGLAQRVLALHPRAQVLFMSGYTADELAPHGVLAPGVDFLQKPFSFRDFALRVHARLTRATR